MIWNEEVVDSSSYFQSG